MELQNEAKKQKSPIKTALNVLYYVVLGVIILASVLYMIATFSTKDGITNIFGNVVSSVQSGSMSGTFEKGDIIIVKEVAQEDIAVGDIIMFRYLEPQTQQRITVTHRVDRFEGGKIVTQGDVAKRNNSIDQVEYVSYGDVIGEYSGFKIPGVGKLADFIKTPVGFFCCILIPVFLFLFWQIFIFIKTVIEVKSISKEKAINDEARALAEQMFREMQSKQEGQAVSAEPTDSGSAE